MALPDPAHNDTGDYTALEKGLLDTCGFTNVQCTIMSMSKHGAYTDRRRYVVVATRTTKPFEFPTEMPTFKGCQRIMLPPDEVPPPARATHYTPKLAPAASDGFSSRRLGTVTRGDGSSARYDVQNRLYDPDYPMPTTTSGYTYGGNKGSQWVLDDLGPRQWTLQEECALHNIDDTAKAFLMTLPYDEALGYIA